MDSMDSGVYTCMHECTRNRKPQMFALRVFLTFSTFPGRLMH